jgi:hypothetical protein
VVFVPPEESSKKNAFTLPRQPVNIADQDKIVIKHGHEFDPTNYNPNPDVLASGENLTLYLMSPLRYKILEDMHKLGYSPQVISDIEKCIESLQRVRPIEKCLSILPAMMKRYEQHPENRGKKKSIPVIIQESIHDVLHRHEFDRVIITAVDAMPKGLRKTLVHLFAFFRGVRKDHQANGQFSKPIHKQIAKFFEKRLFQPDVWIHQLLKAISGRDNNIEQKAYFRLLAQKLPFKRFMCGHTHNAEDFAEKNFEYYNLGNSCNMPVYINTNSRELPLMGHKINYAIVETDLSATQPRPEVQLYQIDNGQAPRLLSPQREKVRITT